MKGTSGALPKVASRDIHFEHPFEKSRVAAVFAQFCCPPFERALAPTQARRSGEVPIQIQIQPPEAIQIQIHGRRRPPDPDLALAWIVAVGP